MTVSEGVSQNPYFPTTAKTIQRLGNGSATHTAACDTGIPVSQAAITTKLLYDAPPLL
eukprot:COSAG01_NODE_8787_length_2659_cov_3.287891_2_plen_58_part_00